MFSLTSLSHALPRIRTGFSAPLSLSGAVRHRTILAPKQVKHPKHHKGRIPIPTGGSTKGTTLAYGEWGLRIKGNGARLTQKQLQSARDVILRRLKILKGSKVYIRVFPDIPVCVKGNESRMGKGKGTFEFWATRVAIGRVIFEIGGRPIREELARKILREAADRLPTQMEFISKSTPPRLGRLLLHSPKPSAPEAVSASSVTSMASTSLADGTAPLVA